MNELEVLLFLAIGIFLFSLGVMVGAETGRQRAEDCQKVSMFHPRLIHSEVRRG